MKELGLRRRALFSECGLVDVGCMMDAGGLSGGTRDAIIDYFAKSF